MKLLKRLASFCALCIFTLSVVAHAAVITLTNGSAIEADGITYVDETLKIASGPKKLSFSRSEIKDISFSAKARESESFADSDKADLPELLEKGLKMAEKYPDSASIIVLDEGNYKQRRDGSSIARYRGVVYIAQDEALSAAQVAVGFDPNRDRVKVIHARSYTSSGKVFSLSPDQIKVAKGTSSSVSFNDYKRLSFTIPKAAIGGLIDFSYEIETFNPYDKNLFQGRFYFQDTEPVATSILRVSVPHDKTLCYTTRSWPTKETEPMITEAVDYVVYTWQLENMPPVVAEPFMPPFRDIAPAVYYSLHKNYDYLHNKLRPMLEKRFQLTQAVKDKVNEICADAGDINEKIARLYQFCQKEIRYISIKGNLASNQLGHPAEETLKNRYGDCTDKSMLLSTMLKHIGVEAYPVCVLTNDAGKSIRDIAIFDDNHCITEVHLDGRIFYLDPTASDYRYPYFRADDHGVTCHNTMLGTISPVALPPPEDNAITSKRAIKILSDGTTEIDFESTSNGTYEAHARGSARARKPEEYEKSVRASISVLTADYQLKIATHSDPLDFSEPFKNRSAYTLNRFAAKSGKYMIFVIPFFELSFSEVSLETRKYDIEYDTSSQRTEYIDIAVPSDYEVKYLPEGFRIQTPYIEFELIYDRQGTQIKVVRKLAFPRRIVPAADYEQYKADLEKIANASKEKIFLQKIQKKPLKTTINSTQEEPEAIK